MPVADTAKPTVAELQCLGVFGALDETVLDQLCDGLPVIRVAAAEFVFHEGDAGRAMYVVLEGELELTKLTKRGHSARVAVLREGDWFGEMSLLDVMARPVTARALIPCRLLKIRPTHLDKLYRGHIKAYALLMMNLARQLSRRLRVAEGILADTVTSVVDHYADDAGDDN